MTWMCMEYRRATSLPSASPRNVSGSFEIRSSFALLSHTACVWRSTACSVVQSHWYTTRQSRACALLISSFRENNACPVLLFSSIPSPTPVTTVVVTHRISFTRGTATTHATVNPTSPCCGHSRENRWKSCSRRGCLKCT